MATYTDNYQLKKPTYAEQADIGVVNSNMNKIDEVMHSSQISLAPAYDSTQTYAEGDVVMYELLMYKCISPTTGVWDASKWERTTASESGGGGTAELDILGEGNGAIVSFADGASAELAKCIAEIVPKQAGSGTPSPDNVRTISGSTSVTVTISDGETSTTKTTPLGQTVYGGQLNVLTGELTIDRAIITYDGSEDWEDRTAYRFYLPSLPTNLTTNYVEKFNSISNIFIYHDVGSEYGRSFAFGGEGLWVNKETSSDTLANFKNYLGQHNLQICYPLATPQTVQLTPQEVNSLLGQNNISADTGDVDIVYVKASAPIQPNPTGTPTATLKKLGIEGTVFEVEGGGGGSSVINYSTTEQRTGQKWIDGKDIYVKVLKTYDMYTPNAVLFNVGDINIIKITGTVNNGNSEVPAAFFSMGSFSYYIATYYDFGSQTIQCYNYGWTISDYNIIIFYTKN